MTHLHLVADPWSGQPYNRAGRVQVGLSDDPLSAPAVLKYQADIALANVALDVAILRIRYDLEGKPLAQLPTFPTAKLGNDRDLPALPDLHLCGFPGTVAGTVHGLYQRHSADGLWIELAAPLLGGFSGAPAWNDRVELVGLLYSTEAAGTGQAARTGQAASYYLRPINALKTLIEMGKQR